jgi:hypothetical protein
MSFFGKILEVATGGLAKEVSGLIQAYFPPDMTPEKKAELQVALERLMMEREKNANDAARDAEEAINERVKIYEGTAGDLSTIPILGPVMLFLRGGQRIMIGYGTVYLDFQVFSGTWKLEGGTQESCFWIINFLVLGFLFGERALRNVAPLLTQLMQAKNGKA